MREKKIKSYISENTPGVRPYACYEKDFNRPGQFKKEIDQEQIVLTTSFYPGQYDGKKWVKKADTEKDSYFISVYYYSKRHIIIAFDRMGKGVQENLGESFNLLRKAARKFYLKNEFISKEFFGAELSWQEIDKLTTNHNSWFKTMTLAEAKKLFEYLKIKVKFPN